MSCRVCESNKYDFTCENCNFGICFSCFDYYLTTETGQMLMCSNCHRNIKLYEIVDYLIDKNYDKSQIIKNIERKYQDYFNENRYKFEKILLDKLTSYKNGNDIFHKIKDTEFTKIKFEFPDDSNDLSSCKVIVEKPKRVDDALFPCLYCDNGKISQDYECNNCEIVLCSKCHEKKHKGRCKTTSVEFAKYTMSLLKCPKCASRIEKGEGCVLMFCTKCYCKFDADTGKILNSHLFHNDLAIEHLEELPTLPAIQAYLEQYANLVTDYNDSVKSVILEDIEMSIIYLLEILDEEDYTNEFLSNDETRLCSFEIYKDSSLLFGNILMTVCQLTMIPKAFIKFVPNITEECLETNLIPDKITYNTLLLTYHTKHCPKIYEFELISRQMIYDFGKKLRLLKENLLIKTRKFIEENINESIEVQVALLKPLLVDIANYIREIESIFLKTEKYKNYINEVYDGKMPKNKSAINHYLEQKYNVEIIEKPESQYIFIFRLQ